MKRAFNLIFGILLFIALIGWGMSVFWQYGFIHITAADWQWILRLDAGSFWLQVFAPPTNSTPCIYFHPTDQPFQWALFYFIAWGDGSWELDFPIWMLGSPSFAYFTFTLLIRRRFKASSDVPATA
jgi:hypothetical protein